ncbi:glycosyltransferase family 2 protein [Janthinobacterium sp. 13]|uniref:glycosyltransferase family 2 protein n=1 Tax=Janthinobacterium sp. 13 TaxID=2035211 RepID=UPI000C16CB21|nr:glycosyltransferase [Janthinobacterium sp. 13]
MNILDIEDQFAICADRPSSLIIDGGKRLMPTLSIMIPTYRRPDMLAQAIRSVLAQASDIDFEIVVVDNDHSMSEQIDELIRQFADDRLRLFRNSENLGMFGNWNRCIELARSEWISILNDDDLLHPDFVAEMFSVLKKDPSISLLYCRSIFMDARGSLNQQLKNRIKQGLKNIKNTWFLPQLSRIPISHVYMDAPSSALGLIFKRSHAMQIGGYKASAFPSSDYVFFTMYFLNFGASRLNKTLAYYRIHENETANPATGEGFIAKNIQLRRALEKHVDVPPSLLRQYAQFYALVTIKQYKNFWNIDLDLPRLRREHGLSKLPATPFFHLSRLVLRLCFLFSRKK